jgi:outer membrane lipoprotein-sorting protein
MRGRGSVSFESPEVAGSAFFAMSLKKPDSLLIMLEGPFGIDAGFLFLSREKFVLYNSLENRVFTGVPSPAAIRSVLPIELTFEQIMEAFTGGFRLPTAVPEHSGMEDETYRVSYRREGKVHTYWIDPAYSLVTRYEVRDSSGVLLIEASSSRVVEKAGVPVPGHVSITFPEDGRRLTIHYTSIEVNGEDVSFDYTIPPNARTTVR